MESQEQITIKEIVNKLGEQKNQFLDEVQTSTHRFISSQGSDCLAIVEKKTFNKVWELSASVSYVEVLIKFCQGKRYNGNELDSYLTEPIIESVTKKFQEFYMKNNDIIADGIFKSLSLKQNIIETISKTLVDNRLTNSDVLKFAMSNASKQILHSAVAKKATDLITNQLNSVIHATTSNSISTPLVKSIGLMIIKLFSKQIALAISKILASAAFKTMIAGALKKVIVALLIGAIVKAIATKFGISAAAAWAVILIPLIIGYIAYEITQFPEKLGSEISVKLKNELNGNFEKLNTDIVSKLMVSFSTFELTGIITNLTNDIGLQKGIDDLILELINKEL